MPPSDRLKEIAEREKAASPGPWTACCLDRPRGCSHVMASEFPVCEVTKGEWGDDYPSLRWVEGQEGTINRQVEAYMEQITYGEVSVEQAQANKAFIAHSREDVKWLLSRIAELEKELSERKL